MILVRILLHILIIRPLLHLLFGVNVVGRENLEGIDKFIILIYINDDIITVHICSVGGAIDNLHRQN